MLEEDPVVIVQDLIETNWDADNTPLTADPRVHTGWYDFGSPDPQVTVTNPEESTVGGGDTGITAGSGDGSAVQVRAGTILVNCWAGTREDMEGQGDGGADVNPKDAAYKMAREVHRILMANASGTDDDSGNPQLTSLSADGIRRLVDTEPESAVFRYEVTARYTYTEKTS